MKISIASDHAGFEQKQLLVEYLQSKGHEVIDRGPADDNRVDYPDFAQLVAADVVNGTVERGVLVCGTGIGMAIAANKVNGVRAANIVSPAFAALCREHNDANVITLSGRFVDLPQTRKYSTRSCQPISAGAGMPAASRRLWRSKRTSSRFQRPACR